MSLNTRLEALTERVGIEFKAVRGEKVSSVVAGSGVTVDSADPLAPIVSATGEVVEDFLTERSKTPDSVSEWWCQPIATELSTPYPRTVLGGISETGEIVVSEMNHATREVRRYIVGQAEVDDHNAPALWIQDGRRPVVMWTNHNDDSQVRFKVGSPDGNLESLTTAPEGAYSINQGASLTSAYTQIFKIEHLSTENTDTFWVFTRGGGTRWGYTVFEVDQATGAGYAVRPWRQLITGGSRQFYITIANAHEGPGRGQVLRFAAGYNPAQPVHDVYYFEINVETERITTPLTPGYSETIATSTMVGDSMPFDPIVPDPVGDDSASLRLMYVRPGPDTPAVAYATWDRGDEDNATYRVTELTGGRLISGGSYLRTENASDIGPFARGFDYSCVFEVPATVPSVFGLGAMFKTPTGGDTGNVFWVRVTASGNIGVVGYDPSGLAPVASVTTTSNPLASDLTNAGSLLGVRVRYDLDNRLITRYVSRDGGASWDPVDSGTIMDSSYDPIVSSGLNTNRHNDAQLRVPKGSAEAQDGLVNIAAFSLKDLDGKELAGFDLTRGEYRAGYGSPARMVRSSPAMSQIITDWATSSYGISGPRVGYTAAANYIAGMTFEDPSTARVVYTAHSSSGQEFLYRNLMSAPGRPFSSTLVESFPSTEARLTRPYGIVNAGGRVGYNFMRDYSPENFREYAGDWHIV